MYILRVTSTPVYNIPHIWRQQDNSTFDLPLSSCVRNLILTHSFVVDFYLDIFFVTTSDVWVSVTPSSLRSGMLWRNVSDLARLYLQNDSMNSTGSHLMIIDISRLMATGAREIPPEGLPDWCLTGFSSKGTDEIMMWCLSEHSVSISSLYSWGISRWFVDIIFLLEKRNIHTTLVIKIVPQCTWLPAIESSLMSGKCAKDLRNECKQNSYNLRCARGVICNVGLRQEVYPVTCLYCIVSHS